MVFVPFIVAADSATHAGAPPHSSEIPEILDIIEMVRARIVLTT